MDFADDFIVDDPLTFGYFLEGGGVIDYKIIREINRKIQENASTIQSELGGGQHGLLSLATKPATYRTVIGQDFQLPVRPPQASPVPTNADVAKIPRYIQIHATKVDQWRQMVNAEDILKQDHCRRST